MEKLSDLISKKIFSFSEGTFVGTVLNVAFDENFNIVSFIVSDDENEIEYSIECNKTTISGDNVFIQTVKQLSRATGYVDRIIGKCAFTNKGVYCGRVNEVYLSKKSAISFVTDMLSFSPSNIGVNGDAIILGNIPKIETKNVFLPQNDEQKVYSMVEKETKDEVEIPHRIATSPNNLIGKMATKDIFGLNNELLLKKYEIITQKKLLEIKKHNKLNILFYSCK